MYTQEDRTTRIYLDDVCIDKYFMNKNIWKEETLNKRLGMAWMRKSKPTKGCKANGKKFFLRN
jgi:SUMO ligase MMS21 Smc5/6 complex component